MNAATIAALATAIPAILGAVTALIMALRSNGHATAAKVVAFNASAVAHQAMGLSSSNKDALQDHVDNHGPVVSGN
jgi:hypothetical protein